MILYVDITRTHVTCVQARQVQANAEMIFCAGADFVVSFRSLISYRQQSAHPTCHSQFATDHSKIMSKGEIRTFTSRKTHLWEKRTCGRGGGGAEEEIATGAGVCGTCDSQHTCLVLFSFFKVSTSSHRHRSPYIKSPTQKSLYQDTDTEALIEELTDNLRSQHTCLVLSLDLSRFQHQDTWALIYLQESKPNKLSPPPRCTTQAPTRHRGT